MSNGKGYQRGRNDQISENELKELTNIALTIANKSTPTEYNEDCDKIAGYVNNYMGSITMTQVRKIYNSIRDIGEVMSLVKLRPMFVYIGARDKKTIDFVRLLDSIVKKIKDDKQLKSFKEFFKAIVAYKAYYEKLGGRK